MKRKYSSGVSSDESQGSSHNNNSHNETKKTCADCGTSKTPLWRGGPAGPKVISPSIRSKLVPRSIVDFTRPSDLIWVFSQFLSFQSLCNACGIRSRKKRRAVIGGGSEKKPKRAGNSNDSLNERLLALGREVLMQRSTVEKQRRKLGEEEQAAVLLMALSYGSVYA